MKKYCLIIIVFLALNNISNAQKLPLNNQYLVNRFSISPSYAGYKGITEGFLGYRKQWVDIQGAPITMMFDINSALGEKVGFGGRIISDKEGIFERLHVSANYAYHLTVASEHIISFGLAGKVYQSNLDLSKIIVEDDDDPVIENRKTLNEAAFNAGASLLYRFKGLNFGVSIPFILNNKSQYNKENEIDEYMLKRHYLGHISYDFLINEKVGIQPYVIVRKADVSPINYDAALLFKFLDQYWIAGAYRSSSDICVSAGLMLKKTILMNYTYEFSGKGITGQTSGTHEISIGFTIGKREKEEGDVGPIVTKDTVEIVKEIRADSNLLKEIEELQNRLMDLELEISKLKEMYSGEELKKREQELIDKIDEIQGRLTTIDEGKDFYVIVESFKYPENAERAVGMWKDRGYNVAIIHNQQRGWYYIVVGTYSTYNEATGMKDQLSQKGIENWIFIKSDY